MEYRTKLDFSSNRQIKQYPETLTILSGATSFGLPFSALTTGPDLLTSGATITTNGVVSTFSGTTGSTTYTWYDNSMTLGYSSLSALTPSNSGITQNTGIIFTSNTTTTIDGNTVALSYSGISFDLTPISMISLGGGIYSGTVYTDVLTIYSAGTLDFTGRTIWVDVSGITRTQKLIITNVGSGPSVTDLGVDANGNVVNQASDIKLKENINTIDDALGKVMALRGVTYNWKDRHNGGDSLKIGFIAQEVNETIPELVFTNNDGTMGVHYKDISALLVEAIKELASGDIISKNTIINTQTIIAEDNNIELNYNGNHDSSIGGGISVNNAMDEGKAAEFITDDDGNWITNNSIKPKSLIIPSGTVKSSDDEGVDGEIKYDNDYLYVRVSNKWKRIKLEEF